MRTMYYLGIDTSNYTTSVALVDSSGSLLYEQRRLLAVPRGQRGLRQSEAVFQHVRALPSLFPAADMLRRVAAVGVSVRPRNVEGSYMPVFAVGHGYGRIAAASLRVPLLECSHQENHLAAGLWSVGWQPEEQFLTVHLSGGTTEVLAVKWNEEREITVLGASRDINAGQFVDRVGVALGLPFPAGPQLEQLARQAKGRVRLATSVEGCDMSFSGPLSAALRLVGDAEPPELARAVEDCIARALEKALLAAFHQTGCRQVLLMGGVAANGRIRKRLTKRLAHPARNMELRFAAAQAARDSAIGAAILAWQALGRNN